MAVNDVYSVVLRQRMHGQTILNVLHYREVVTGTGPAGLNLAQDIATVIIPLMKPLQSSDLVHESVVVQKIYPLPPSNPITNVTAAGPGTDIGNALPTSVALVITKRTNFAGRKYRGRVFVCGIPEDTEVQSAIAPGKVAAFQALADSLALNKGTSGWTYSPVIWHRSTKTNDDVTSCLIRPNIRNQRRRQVGRGE